MQRLEGKVAIVTGGASGIGRTSSELFAREGAAVVVADLHEGRAKETAEAIQAAGGRALAQQTDIGEPASIDAMVEATIAEFGALHVLFNNAADTSPGTLARDGLIEDMEIDLWDHVMAVDLRGAMWCSKRAIPHIAAAGGGSIVNTSSNQSLAGDMSQSAYGVAKAGIDHLTRYIATQCGQKGIRCNTLSPGLILTPAVDRATPEEMKGEVQSHSPMGRLGVPEDLAYAALFLASDESTYITGQTISVDGGQLAHLPHYAHVMRTGMKVTHQTKP
jgi:NAD(P)-dependent dehydrogenase (short-subunit alcohol dehydrogenase family)